MFGTYESGSPARARRLRRHRQPISFSTRRIHLLIIAWPIARYEDARRLDAVMRMHLIRKAGARFHRLSTHWCVMAASRRRPRRV